MNKFVKPAKHFRRIAVAASIGIFVLTMSGGCADGDHPEPPVERSNLVLRLFRSMRSAEADDAVNQAEKLESISDSANRPYLRRVIHTQTANLAIIEAQTALRRGDLASARKAIEKGLNATPANAALLAVASELDNLAAERRLIGELRTRAADPAARRIVIIELGKYLQNSKSAPLKQSYLNVLNAAELDCRLRNLTLNIADRAEFELLDSDRELDAALYTTILAERELESVPTAGPAK